MHRATKRTAIALLVLTILTACTEMSWRKEGVDEASTRKDEQTCRSLAEQRVARMGGLAPAPVGDPRFGPPMGANPRATEKLLDAQRDMDNCMRDKGYKLVPDGK